MCRLNIVLYADKECGHTLMSRDSCRVNNPFCCELEECDVYYDTIEGICYLCKERHRYLRKKELAAEHAKKDENDQRKEKMDADVEMEEGEIRDQEMDVDKDSKEDRLEVVSPSDDPNEKQEREENLMSKKKQLAEIEQAMEEAKLLNEELKLQTALWNALGLGEW